VTTSKKKRSGSGGPTAERSPNETRKLCAPRGKAAMGMVDRPQGAEEPAAACGSALEASEPVVADTSIHQDARGRFSLNDLHRASGGAKRNGPAYFLARAETKALVAEIDQENTGIPAISRQRGRGGGTFVCEDLVYAYAMWINPKFCLRVIRAFRKLTGQSLRQRDSLYSQRLALEAQEAASMERGSIGSNLMHGRRREIPLLREQRAAIERAMEPCLPLFPTADADGVHAR